MHRMAQVKKITESSILQILRDILLRPRPMREPQSFHQGKSQRTQAFRCVLLRTSTCEGPYSSTPPYIGMFFLFSDSEHYGDFVPWCRFGDWISCYRVHFHLRDPHQDQAGNSLRGGACKYVRLQAVDMRKRYFSSVRPSICDGTKTRNLHHQRWHAGLLSVGLVSSHSQKTLSISIIMSYKGAGRSEIQSAVRAVMEIVAPCPFIFAPDISPSGPGRAYGTDLPKKGLTG